MANPNNLVRPPVLNSETQNIPRGTPNAQLSLDDLRSLISNIALDVVTREGPQVVQATLNPDANLCNVADQVIEDRHRANLGDLDRIPDVVKCLKEFSGHPGEFNSWKKSVDRILNIYEHLKGSPKYYGILSVIRNKIIGNADMALESYNTPLDWPSIARCLTTHYADKRDLSTLEYQMTTIVQGNRSIQEYYQQVYTHLSLMLNKIGCMDMGNESLHMLTQSYRNKALDTFIRGLNGDLPKLLGIKEPADLPQALHLCLKLENQNLRTSHAHISRRYQSAQKGNAAQSRRPFYPEIAHIPRVNQPRQQFTNQWHQNNAMPPRPPKPQPRPEPMDVDPSIHSRRINYMNRPNQDQHFGKRTQQFGYQQQNKNQRTFHINTSSTKNKQGRDEDKQFGEPTDIHFLA